MSDELLGRLLIDQGLVKPEQVGECLRLISQLSAEGVTPLPGLGELLVRKGYLSAAGAESTFRSSAPSDIPAGERVGKYVKSRKIGEGGMGEVWKAWDSDLNRWVALKFLKSADAEERSRFRREAQTAAKLSHPNIAAVYEAGEKFIAMQYVDGPTLAAVPRDDARRLVEHVRQAALAVHAAHEQGVIHRDLKPANIMVEKDRVFVMDFGLARSMNVQQSATGTIVGTPAYMSPEQAWGSRELDHRTDVYSLGATLYELLANRLPFHHENAYELMKRVIGDEPAPPPGGRELQTIVMKCLEKDPARRYGNALQLAEDLRRWLAGEPILAHPPSSWYRLRKFVARKKGFVSAVAVAVALAAALATWAVAGSVRKGRLVAERLREARRLESERKLSAARDAFRAVLDVDSGNAEAREGERRVQARLSEAARLLEAARLALDQATAYLYYVNAQYPELARRADEGRKSAEQALEIVPDSALGWYLVARSWDLKGWDDRAEDALRRALRLDPEFLPAHYLLGRVLLIRSFLGTLIVTGLGHSEAAADPSADRLAEEAVREINWVISRGGLDAGAALCVAGGLAALARRDIEGLRRIVRDGIPKYGKSQGSEDLYWLAGITDSGRERKEAYDEALRIRPVFPLVYFSRGSSAELRANPTAALVDLGRAIEFNPRFWAAYLNRAHILGERKDYAAALKDYDALLAIRPGLPTALRSRADVRRELGDTDGALADASEAIRLEPNWAESYVSRGQVLRARGDNDGAARDFDRALQLRPGHKGALLNRSGLRRAAGDAKGAFADADAVIQSHPDMAEAYLARGNARRHLGDADGAMRDFDTAIEKKPDYADAYYNRGNIRQARGDRKGAIADYDQAIRHAPRFVAAYINRGLAREGEGDLEGARKDLDLALTVDPRSAVAWYNRSRVRLAQGEIDGAIEDAGAAIAIEPRYANAWAARGRARQKKGDLDGAIADYEEALRVAPDEWSNRSLIAAWLEEARKERDK